MITDEGQARGYCAQHCSAEAMAQLERFIELLREENGRQNLIAKASLDHVWQRHIADSVQLLERVPRETTGPILDLGSGAGFPGLVLAIARPDQSVVLVESRRKRVEWLQSNIDRFALKNCRVIRSRIESVDSFPAGVITARAFAPLARLIELSARFSTPDTLWLLPKGRSAAQERAGLPPRLARMFHVEQSLTDPEAQILVGKRVPAGK